MWRHIAGSVRGASHEKNDEPCQDRHVARITPAGAGAALVACVSDGAGSASQSHHGAHAACDAIARRAERYFDQHGAFSGLTRDDALAWCAGAREEIEQQAQEAERPSRDYACTLSVALAAADHAVFFQIGDGAIVARQHGVYGVVFWPQSGEYANSTNFLTQENYGDHLVFHNQACAFGEVALFTDGLERLALKFENQTPHAPFFDPLFTAVRQAEDLAGLNDELQRFLTSETVQNRSDDDKTVILAAQVADR